MPRPNQGPYLVFLDKRQRWYIRHSERGRTREFSTGTDDREQAHLALAEFIKSNKQITHGSSIRDPGKFPISEALALYGTEHAPHAADPRRIGYAIASLVPFWGDRMLGDITRETCRAYARHRGKSAGTIRRELATLRAAGNYARQEGRLTYMPTVHLPPKPAGKDRFLRMEEAAALLNAARNGHASTRPYLPLFILIALYTGARKGAILDLQWPQVDLQTQRIDFNPPGRSRTSKGRARQPIPRKLLTLLRLARKRGTDSGYVIHRDGAQLGNMKRAFNNAAASAGLAGVTPHTLRHTCGTWLAQAGVSLDKIGGWLGHTDARTTQLYAHHHPDFMKDARDAADRQRM